MRPRVRATPRLTDQLCTHCGLCCDGSLFADVELAGEREATGLVILGLEVEDYGDSEGPVLVQPCRALRGRRCGIYAHRPDCCRTFECGLLQDARSGAVRVERARRLVAETIAEIRKVKQLLSRLGHFDETLPLRERCAEALAANPDGRLLTARRRTELGAAIKSLELRIRNHFLRRRGGLPGSA